MVAPNQVRIINGTRATVKVEAGEGSISEIDAAEELRAVFGIGMEAFFCASRCSGSGGVGWAQGYVDGKIEIGGRVGRVGRVNK